MKKVALLLCVFLILGSMLFSPVAYAYTDAASKIQIYYQQYKSTNTWSQLKLSGNNTMGTSGCLIFAYAHAIQWFTNEKVTGTSLLTSMISEGNKPWDYSISYYAGKSTCKSKGIYAVSGSVTASNITSIFDKGQVILANTSFKNKGKGHYILAVDYTTRDVDGDGKADTLIHVVDSAMQSTYRRVVAEDSGDRNGGYYARGFKMYNFSSFSAMGRPGESCGQYWIKAADFVSAMNKAMQILACNNTQNTPAASFSFQNVTYPQTFKINTSNGWNLGGGTLVCDKKLKTITTTITTADGKTNISGPKTYSNLNSYSYTIKNLDTMDGSNNGVRFSYIKNAGKYIWVLTATDEAGRTLTLSMPFTAVSSGSTATATKSVTYTSEIAYGFTTPASLKIIDSETFSGITAKSVRIAGKVTKIGSKAFANCSKLVSIYIPSSCTSIASDAFSGLSSLIIYGQSGSCAETFAKEKGFTFYPVLSFTQRIRQYILAGDNEKVYNPALDLDGNSVINSLDYIEAAKTE